jgi:hypothetical protein
MAAVKVTTPDARGSQLVLERDMWKIGFWSYPALANCFGNK